MRTRWAILILILAGIIAYANTAKNGLFWDDDEFITRNAYVRSFRYLPQWFSRPLTAGAGVNSNYYRPLLQLSFAIDYKLWGLWPAGYHIENLLWHTFAGVLLFILLRELLFKLKVKSEKLKVPYVLTINHQSSIIAFSTALLWLVHPVHVEAVAYANSRGDSMATAFILLTLILWMKKRFWASATAFVLALLSKEFAIVTPGLILLVELFTNHSDKHESLRNSQSYIDDGRSSLIYITNLASEKLYRLLTIVVNLYNFIKPVRLHITIAVIYLTFRLTVLNFQNTLNFYGVDLSRADRGDPLVKYATSLPVRLMTFLKVLPIYGRILVWPDDLHMERTVEIAATAMDPTVITVLGGLILIGGLFLFVVFKGPALRRKAGPYQIFAFAFVWFFVSILPTSGIVPISQILAEHFLYLPSIGFFLIISWAIVNLSYLSSRHPSGLARNDEKYNLASYLSLIFVLLLAIPLVTKTIRQNRIWRDPITFYEYTLARAEPTARVYNNLAMAYADAGQHQKAINNYQLAISLGDVYPNPHYNLGNTFIELGKLDEAEREYQRALEIDPSFHYTTLKLGQMYLDQEKIDAAKKLVCPVFPTQPLCPTNPK